MSLRHMDENENNKKNTQNNYDIFPELDELFDDFDSKKREELGLSKPPYEQHENYFKKDKAKEKKTLPVFDEEMSDKKEIHLEDVEEESGSNIHDEKDLEIAHDNEEFDVEDFNEEVEDDKDFNEEDYHDEEFEEDKEEFEDTEEDKEEYEELEEDLEELNDNKNSQQSEFEEKEEGLNENGKIKQNLTEHIDSSKENKESKKKNESSGFKEIDEEKAKEFFSNLLSKLKPKKNKESKKKNKESKLKKESHENSKPEKPKKESKFKEKLKKENFNLSKKGKIIASSVIITLLLIATLFVFSNKGYSEISNLSFSIDNDLKISELSPDKKNVKFTMSNDGDISKSLFFYVTLQEKGLIPFMGSKIECESDIIDITSGGGTESNLKCSQALDENKKYKYSESTISEI